MRSAGSGGRPSSLAHALLSEEIFRHVQRLLKPSGRVYFSEHTLGSLRVTRACQHLASPFWLCHCNRDSIAHLRRQPWVKENWLAKRSKWLLSGARS